MYVKPSLFKNIIVKNSIVRWDKVLQKMPDNSFQQPEFSAYFQ
jgi:hypothetical protein